MKLERNLGFDLQRATEAAALRSARWMGRGDKNEADGAAVDAMRFALGSMDMDGLVVIGEGEKDEAPMLYIGERIGNGNPPAVDIAVDPVEGTTLLAQGMPGAIAVVAAAERGSLFNPPGIVYMDKIAVGESAKGCIAINAPVAENIRCVAKALKKHVEDVTVVVLDRPRHRDLIDQIRETGARIKVILHGDVAGSLMPSMLDAPADMLMGIGGAPEGVITAAAMKCLNGEIQARLVFDPERLDVDSKKVPPEAEVVMRLKEMGIEDPNKVYSTDDLAPGKKIIFAATGVTDGALLRGVRFFGAGKRTHSLVMTTESRHIRFVDTVHVEGGPETVIRF